MMKKLGYIVLIMFGLTSYSVAQDVIAGLHYDLGTQHFKRGSDGFITAGYPTHHIGLQLVYSPYYSLLFISTGAEYTLHDLGTGLSIPLTFRIAPGKKLRPFAELGAYYSLVLTDAEDDYLLNNELGLRFRGGLQYTLNKKVYIELSYLYAFGLNPKLEEVIRLPLDQYQTEEYKSSMKGLSLGMKYRIY